MSFAARISKELPSTVALAVPMGAVQLSQMLMGVIDTAMVGHLGTVPLAACGFGNNLVIIPFLFGVGLMSGLTVTLAHAHGAGQPEKVSGFLWHGFLLALVTGLMAAIGLQVLVPVLFIFGQPPEVTNEAAGFVSLLGWSLVPVFLGFAGKNLCEALGRPWPVFGMTLGGVVLNAVLNWIFIYGNLGAPAMGLTGAGLATLLARWFVVILLFAFLVRSPRFRQFLPRTNLQKLSGATFKKLWVIGLPAGLQIVAEAAAFSFSGVTAGWIGTTSLAAHQVALSCASTAFMIPLGLSMALSVRLGTLWGSGETPRLRPVVAGTLLAGMVFSLVAMGLFLGFSTAIVRFFANDPDVVTQAVSLLVVVGLFQFVDGAQVISVGGLRGLHDTQFPAWFSLFCYWVVSLPLSMLLAFGFRLGTPGIWVGLAIGLAIAAVIFTRRLWRMSEAGPARHGAVVGK